ncbi:hypothetical protein [Jiulongibacter sp. NS-SX5]|uniref:hypothetical protein n=1 Tax=Jiulongibacter sp. NS-SX5 TaxID=3463854 RepID=UPI00405855B9
MYKAFSKRLLFAILFLCIGNGAFALDFHGTSTSKNSSQFSENTGNYKQNVHVALEASLELIFEISEEEDQTSESERNRIGTSGFLISPISDYFLKSLFEERFLNVNECFLNIPLHLLHRVIIV